MIELSVILVMLITAIALYEPAMKRPGPKEKK